MKAVSIMKGSSTKRDKKIKFLCGHHRLKLSVSEMCATYSHIKSLKMEFYLSLINFISSEKDFKHVL